MTMSKRCCLFTDLAPRGSSHKKKQYVCKVCGTVHTQGATRVNSRAPYGKERIDNKGRIIVYLGVQHPYANTGGWQYRYRLRVMQALGRKLRSDEHVDHIDGNCANDDLRNLRVMMVDDHGRRHTCGNNAPVLAEYVEGRGFIELNLGDDMVKVNEIPF